jgi:hypothetical protein
MYKSVFCTATVSKAGNIIPALRAADFSNNDVSVLLADKEGAKDFAFENNTKAPEGAVAGAGTGAVLGGALGWLAGIGSLAIPGLGPFIVAGPIMVALSGVALGGALGGLSGALIGMGMPEFEAKRFEGKVKTGSCLISIDCKDSNDVRRAKEICEHEGAKDITSAGEAAVVSMTPAAEVSLF